MTSTSFTRGENPLRADKLNQALSERVNRDGDTMLGPLILSRDPVETGEAATKQYVDLALDALPDTSASGKFVTGYNATILTDDRHGVLIPGYIYPGNPYSNATFQNLLSIMRRYHDVPVIYVINPSNGPGAAWDGNYAAAIRLLRGVGASVVGYISTQYAARDPALVRADVDTWMSMYAATPIDGIFFDEMPWELGAGESNIALYQSYCSYVHSKGLQIVIGNPGTNEQGKWYLADPPTADIIVTWETFTYPTEGDLFSNFTPDGHVDYTWKRNCVLVHSQPFNATTFAMMKKYVKWFWITDDTFNPSVPTPPNDNPWDQLPTYMDAIFSACRTRSYARMQAAWPTGTVLVNSTVYFAYDAPYDGIINSMTHFCTTGSFTANVQINGVSVTGLSAVAPTSTPTTTNATAARTFTAGQRISCVLTSAAGSPTNALLSLNVTWT
jgi:hypothetical protein